MIHSQDDACWKGVTCAFLPGQHCMTLQLQQLAHLHQQQLGRQPVHEWSLGAMHGPANASLGDADLASFLGSELRSLPVPAGKPGAVLLSSCVLVREYMLNCSQQSALKPKQQSFRKQHSSNNTA